MSYAYRCDLPDATIQPMSTESYVDSMRPRIAEITKRSAKVWAAVDMVRAIVRKYAQFDTSEDDNTMQTMPAYWNEDNPHELVWFELRDSNDEKIKQASVADMNAERRASVFRRANFVLTPDWIFGTVFTVNTEPPDVWGLDGKPCTSTEIDSIMIDMQQYENALAAGRGERQADS